MAHSLTKDQEANEPITEEWLKQVGFKWHQLDRQPDKHWLLWLGDALRDGRMFCSHEDLGIEVALGGSSEVDSETNPFWFCWLRSDAGRLYSRFIHIHYVYTQSQLIRLIEAITRLDWNPANHLYGGVRTQKQADAIRADYDRMDRRIMRDTKWREIEKDDSRGGALPEHLEHHATGNAE